MEKNWVNWDLKETILWFKYNLLTVRNGDVYDDSDDDSEDEMERGGGINVNINGDIDWNKIESTMKSFGFRAKRNFPNMNNHYIFKQFGFENKFHCKLLCQKTKRLLQKYPKANKKNNKNNKVEGMVEDTNYIK